MPSLRHWLVVLGVTVGGCSSASLSGSDAEPSDARGEDGGIGLTVTADGSVTLDAGRLGDGGAALSRGVRFIDLRVLGHDRHVLLYVPARWEIGAPAIIALHGSGDTPVGFLQLWPGLQAVADEHAVALALPASRAAQGEGDGWDGTTRPPENNADVQLVNAVREHLDAGGADSSRIYLLGRNRGGFVAYHAGMEASTRFAAMHLTGSASPLGRGLAAAAEREIPVDMLIGQEDPLLDAARATHDELREGGFEVRMESVPRVGVCCPLRGRVADVWAWLAERSL